MKQKLPNIRRTVSSRGVIIIAQAQGVKPRFFYSNKENVINCPYAICLDDDEMIEMYRTGTATLMYVGWYWKRIEEAYIEVDGSSIKPGPNGYIGPMEMHKVGLHCAQVYLPILGGR